MDQALFLTDVDGTLLTNDYSIPAHVVAAAARFRAAGGRLALCTGRAPISARTPARILGTDAPSILWGGAAIYDFSSESCLWKAVLPSGALEGVRAAYERFPRLDLLVYTQEEIFTLRRSPFLERKGIPEEVRGPLCSFEDIQGEPIKIVAAGESAEELEACGRDCFPSDCQAARSSTHFLEVVAPGADKGGALEVLSELLGIPARHVFGAGDGMTDLPMLERAGRSYTMPHAPLALKEAADMVLPPVREGGMATAFQDALAHLSGG